MSLACLSNYFREVRVSARLFKGVAGMTGVAVAALLTVGAGVAGASIS